MPTTYLAWVIRYAPGIVDKRESADVVLNPARTSRSACRTGQRRRLQQGPSALLFLGFADVSAARSFLAALEPELATASEVRRFNGLFKEIHRRGGGLGIVESSWANLALTFHSLEVLAAPGIQDFPDSFKSGMAARSDAIGDKDASAPATWVAPFNQPIDAVVILASDTPGDLDAAYVRLRAKIQPPGVVELIACDFFTAETLWLGRLYVLFFIKLVSRRVHLAGCTANPSGTWTAQQARQLAWSLSERPTPIRFLIHDRDSKFTHDFDEIFRSEGVEVIRTPFQAPQANAFAERWVGTIRRDCLDWILIVSRRQLEQVLRVYVDHYNGHRPHRALGLTPPTPHQRLRPVNTDPPERVHRRDRLGGLIHEYAAAA